jgi:hypothetical protein
MRLAGGGGDIPLYWKSIKKLVKVCTIEFWGHANNVGGFHCSVFKFSYSEVTFLVYCPVSFNMHMYIHRCTHRI